jgi:hypothetical protein
VTLERAIISALQQRSTGAMFVTELQHALANVAASGTLDAALHALTESGALIVVDHPPPDVHLHDIDLRIVAAATPDARAAVQVVWHDFLREFLAAHRCS